MALLITLEVIGIPLAASIVEILARLGDSVVVIPLDVASARSLIHLKKAHAWKAPSRLLLKYRRTVVRTRKRKFMQCLTTHDKLDLYYARGHVITNKLRTAFKKLVKTLKKREEEIKQKNTWCGVTFRWQRQNAVKRGNYCKQSKCAKLHFAKFWSRSRLFRSVYRPHSDLVL